MQRHFEEQSVREYKDMICYKIVKGELGLEIQESLAVSIETSKFQKPYVLPGTNVKSLFRMII